jgi:hypothetical protein
VEKSVIEVILQYGGLGAVLIVVGFAYFKKDQALVAEQQLRIKDAHDYLTLAMKLQESVISAVNKLSDIVEVFEKRETSREARETSREARERMQAEMREQNRRL